MKKSYEALFENNKKWLESQLAKNPDFFKTLSATQTPEYLYIGCSDSRVSAEEMMGMKPGELFVHRNIANMVNTLDMSATAVIQYAVEHLQVKHIIVCGHYGCGGIKAAMKEEGIGKNSPWLQIIKDIYRIHKSELEKIKDETKRYDRLVELNVIEQTENVVEMDCIQALKGTPDYPEIHGWVFDMRTGKIVELDTQSSITNQTDKGSLSLIRKLKSLFKKR